MRPFTTTKAVTDEDFVEFNASERDVTSEPGSDAETHPNKTNGGCLTTEYREYGVNAGERRPLVDFMVNALQRSGCRLLSIPDARVAPFRLTFETREGERMGIVAYAFNANSKVTTNRPKDEHRLQIKYGPKDGKLHDIWTDPFHVYTTLFLGIDTERGIFVGADPVLHNPTKFFISLEFKRRHVEEIQKFGWYSWERSHRAGDDKPVEVLVGGTADSFLHYIRFEREALGLDPGHRQLLAEKLDRRISAPTVADPIPHGPTPGKEQLHSLAREFEMKESEVLDMISKTRMLKMAVRGWVAEEHLVRQLSKVQGVSDCHRSESKSDVQLRFRNSRPIIVECKNVLHDKTKDGLVRIDFQRTRAAKADPCSRYYGPGDFDVVAGCLHAITEQWEFKYTIPSRLDAHKRCAGKLASTVKLDDRWSAAADQVLGQVVGTK